MKQLNIAFLGTGWIAGSYVTPLAQMPGVRVSALCNHHIEKAQKFNAEKLEGKATCYDDFATMLANEKLDALFICIPPGAHAGEAEAAAKKGIHLMLEKPIALSIERAESIRAAVRSGGALVQIGHHMRHASPVIHLKRLIDSGQAGRGCLFQGRWFGNGRFPAWWRTKELGGGQLVEQSIHLYDMARHFFGDVESAHGYRANQIHDRFPDYKVDDISCSAVRFKSGALANIAASNTWAPNSGAVDFTVQFEKVLAIFKSHAEAEFIYHGGLKGEEVKAQGIDVKRETLKDDGNNYAELCRNFVAAIRGEEPMRSTIDDGVEGLRLVLDIARSAE